MRILFYELGKIFGNVKLLLLLLGVALFNVAFLVYEQYNSEYSPSAYNAIWEDLEQLSPEEQRTMLQNKLDKINDAMFFDEAGESESNYTGNLFGELTLTEYVKGEVDSCLSYSDYLASIKENAENLIALPFFAEKKSFDYKNIMKTCEDFSHLEGKALTPQPAKAVLTAVGFGVTDIFALLIILLFNIILISREKELEQINLFRSTENGGLRLALAKLVTIFVGDIASIILLYGGSLAAGQAIYGFGDLSRNIQTVYGFFGCNLDISVGEFLVYFVLLKLLVCLAFSALCFFLSSLTLGSILNIAATAVFAAIEAVLYFLIEPSSIFALFRQINIIGAADSGRLLGNYLNVNIFGCPVSALPLSAGVAALCTVIFSVFGAAFFCKLRQTSRFKISFSLPLGKHTGLFRHELHKSFIGGKAALLLIAAALFILFTDDPVQVSYLDISDIIYVKYVNQLKGEITEEKLDFISTELEAAYSDLSESSAYRIEALNRLQAHALYLMENGGLLFNEKGYEMLTGCGAAKQNDRFTACAMAVLMTVIAGYIYCEEYKTGTFRLLRAAPNGHGRAFLCKLSVAALAALGLILIFNGSRFYNVLSAYGTEFIDAPVNSMESLEAFGKMPIGGYLALLEAGRFFALVAQSALIFLASRKIQSYSLTVVGGIAAFAAPPVIAAAGVEVMDRFLLNALLTGNVF